MKTGDWFSAWRIPVCFFAASLFFALPLNAQGWEWEDNGIISSLESVHFADSSSGWIAGSDGIILYTASGGAHWSSQVSGTSSWLKSIHFVDADYGWAAGFDGTIIHTTNAGREWTSQSSGTTEPLMSVMFVDRMNGWVAGNNNTILHTVDGGNLWVPQSSGVGNIAEIHGLYFIDANNGWAVGDGHGVLFHTTDGGASWIQQAHSASGELTAVYFLDQSNGWAVGWSGSVLHTIDGGNTWSLQVVGTMTDPFLSICFSDVDNGWIVGSLGVIYRTRNGGKDWTTQFDPAGRHQMTSVYLTDSAHGWAVGSHGTILRTLTGGDGVPRPNRVILKLPANHSMTQSSDVRLIWGASIPDVDRYSLEYAGDSMFTNSEIDSMLTDSSVTLHGITGPEVWWRVRAHNATGWGSYSRAWNFSVLLTGVGEQEVPSKFSLEQNYPNPFNPTTAIRYSLTANSHVKLIIYNMLGQPIATLVNEAQPAGYREVIWNGTNDAGQKVVSGIYLYKISTEKFTATRRMILLK